ncbi:MAG: SusC/RagA family TonB-linked outer membrane protein [Ferruginibacter sp.]
MRTLNSFEMTLPTLKRFRRPQFHNPGLINRNLLLTGALIFGILASCFSQEKTISGNIKSADGKLLDGVSIQVKGTSHGTTTDAGGNYTLKVKDGAILVVSDANYIGREVPVGLLTVVDIILEQDIKGLGEVVVTAFGIERQKKSIGYSQQKIDGSVLTQARETNVMNSLKGRVAGVHVNQSSGGPAGSSYITIRGNSSLAGNNQPLFVVDGFPINNSNLRPAASGGQNGGRDYGDGVKDINPDDIESISVLKGANAAALYGSRGANGVVLITTKKSAKKGLGVSYNSNATFETINTRPTFQNKWSGGYEDSYVYWTDSTTVNGIRYQLQNGLSDAQYGGPLDGRLAVIETIPELGPIHMSPQPEDNVNSLYRTGTTYTNTVALTGGNETSNIRLSLSNLSNKGILPNNSFNRQTVNLVATSNITARLKIEAKANYIRETNKNRPVIGASYQNVSRTFLALPRNIDLNWLKNYKRADGSMVVWLNGDLQNPYWSLNEILEEDQRDRLIGYVSLNYKFADWLNLKVGAANDSYTDVRNERVAKGTPDRNGAAGAVRNFQYHVNELNADAILTAQGKLSKNFSASFLVGGNLYQTKTITTGLEGGNLNYPDFYQISNAGIVIPTSSLGRKEVQSAFFNGQLAYKNYLFLDITGRNDWSSSLGSPSFFYPSFSLSHVLTDALNIKSKLLSYAKIRASYAQAGTDANIYQTKAGYSILPVSSGFDGQQFAQISQNVPNATLKNELKKSYEFGTDIRLLKNRVGIDFTYYNASTANQILPISVSGASGFTTKLINAGEIQNKGIELYINTIPVQMLNSFSWEVSLNFSKNKSEVISLAPGISNNVMLSTNNVSIEARPGQPFGNIVGYPFKLSPDGRRVIEGGIYARGSDRVVLGNIQPDWLAGVTNTFSYRGIRLSALIDIRKGGQIYSSTMDDEMGNGTGKFTENRGNLIANGVVLDPVTNKYTENSQVVFAEQYYAYQSWTGLNEAFVINADCVSLREATLGYEFRPKILSKMHFKTAIFSIVGRNLLYLYRDPKFKIMGISPETAFAPTAAAQGYEAITMPTTRSIGLNLSLSF